MNTDPKSVIYFTAGVVALYLISVMVLSNALKRHPKAWDRAGRFHLFLNNTPITGLRFLKFIFSTDYRSLNDKPLAQKLWIVRALLALGMIMIVWSSAMSSR